MNGDDRRPPTIGRGPSRFPDLRRTQAPSLSLCHHSWLAAALSCAVISALFKGAGCGDGGNIEATTPGAWPQVTECSPQDAIATTRSR